MTSQKKLYELEDQLDPTASTVSISTSGASNSSNSLPFKGITGRSPIELYLSCNDDYMSEYQCIVRKQIEYFEATTEDVETIVQGRNRPIVLGQVGIRCRHCSLLNMPVSQRAHGSTYYPTKLQGIYQASQNMAQTHLLELCPFVPPNVRNDLIRTRARDNNEYGDNSNDKKRKQKAPRSKEKSVAGAGKQFWAQTAAVLGIYEDTESDILRFDPNWVQRVLLHHNHETEHQGHELMEDESLSTISTFPVFDEMHYFM